VSQTTPERNIFAHNRRYKLGDPFDNSTNVGPVVSPRAAQEIVSQVTDALSKGAVDATPPNASFASVPNTGTYVAPRLLINVNHDMQVMRDETFGPLLPVMKVRDDAEAVELMNDSNFGLTASIWTKDVDVARGLQDEVEAGTVFINRCDFPSPVGSLLGEMCAEANECAGSFVDWVERFWTGEHAGPEGVRWLHDVEEPPHSAQAGLDWLAVESRSVVIESVHVMFDDTLL
jgi:hypothetical protein